MSFFVVCETPKLTLVEFSSQSFPGLSPALIDVERLLRRISVMKLETVLGAADYAATPKIFLHSLDLNPTPFPFIRTAMFRISVRQVQGSSSTSQYRNDIQSVCR